MSTNKHIEKICIAAVCLMLVLTILFMNGGSLGINAIAKTMKYESTLFDTSYVHKIDIVMNDWDSFIETCESEEYTSCTVVIDGKQHKNVAIRAKGNTSLSNVKSAGSQRYSFKLEFDHYEKGKSCDGLDKLCLNNLIQDNTMMKDYIAYMLMNDFGVDSPLCSFVYITVNGQDWGLYLAVEGVEDSFLQRNYGSDAGELYKPDSLSFGGGRGNGKDFDFNNFDFSGTDSDQTDDTAAQTPSNPDDSVTQTPDNAGSETSQTPGNTDGGNISTEGSFEMPGNNSNFEMPSGFTPGGEMPGNNSNFEMPSGFTPGGEMPGNNSNFEMPAGFTPGGEMPGNNSNFEMPAGFTPGGQMSGNSGNAEIPAVSASDEQTSGNSGVEAPAGSTDGGQASGDSSTVETLQIPGDGGKSFDFSQMGGGFANIFGSMSSSDVKLQYIDDDPESYSNIFDSAKTDVSKKDKQRMITALKNLSEYTNLEDTLDIDEVLRYFVVHSFLVNGDSYTGSMIHNYYLHENDGKLAMIPWDYNLAFGTFMGGSASSSVNDSIDTVLSDRPMQAWIFSDEKYTVQYHTLYSEFIEKWFSDGQLEKLIADTAEMLRPYVEKDPTKFCTTEDYDTGVEVMKKFVSLRAEAVSRQLDGNTTAVEAADLNLSDMGSMAGNMGGNMGGDMPSFPSGDMPSFPGGNMPSFPGGNMPGFTGGDMSGFTAGNMPGFAGGSMPGVTAGSTSDGSTPQNTQTPSAETDATSSATTSATEAQGEKTDAGDTDPSKTGSTDNRPDPTSMGNSFTPGNGPTNDGASGSSELYAWVSIGVSAVVLVIGLLIAIKKKY